MEVDSCSKRPDTRSGAPARNTAQREADKEAPHNSEKKAESGERSTDTEEAGAQFRRLAKENQERHLWSEILESKAAFSATEFDRPQK